MSDISPALLRRLEVQAQRCKITLTKLLEQWLVDAEGIQTITDQDAFAHNSVEVDKSLSTRISKNVNRQSNDSGDWFDQINAALAESEQRFRIISEMTSDYAYSFRVMPNLPLKLDWITVNAFQRITEFTPTEVTQNGGWRILVHPDDRDETDQIVGQLLTTEMEASYEYRIITKSGGIRYIHAVNKSVKDDTGRICCIYGTAKDITPSKIAQFALEASETRNRIISELSSDYALCFQLLSNGQLKYEWCTEVSFQKMTGFTVAEADAHGWGELVHPDDMPLIETLIKHLLPDGGVDHVDHRALHKDGIMRYVTSSCHVVTDSPDHIIRIYVSVTDITDRRRYEEALRDSEQRYRMLADNVIDTIVSVDAQNCVIYISPSIEQLLGYKPEEFLGKSPIDWVHPDELDELYERWNSLLIQGGGFQRSEYRMRHKDGHYVWIETISQIDMSPAVSVWRDITERKKAEEALNKAESRFAAVFHHSPMSISLRPFDQERYVEVNDAFLQLFGYQREEILSGAIRSADLWIDESERSQFTRIRAEKNRVMQFEHQFRKKNGEISVALLSSVVVEINGEPYSITFSQDISERKHSEQMLRDAESRFSAVFHNSPISITLRDQTKSQFVEINDAFVNLIGYSREELMSGQVKIADLWADSADRAAYLRERVTQNPIMQVEHRLRKKSGELVTVLMYSAVVTIDGKPLSITLTQDISERKQAEQIQRERDQLRIALEKEHEINQMANQVIRTISHEFRTPLATIRSATFTLGRMSGDLSDPTNTEKREKRLQVVNNQVTILDQLIDDISLLIRNMSGQLPFQPTSIALALLCRATVEELQSTLGMRHKLLFETTDEIQEIVADKKLLERVLINLLSNAIKYSAPDTMIRLSLSRENDQALIRIIDQGWGIAPVDLDQLFTPYFRVDEAHGVSGVGLGLSIVRECVERHHGKITVSSELGTGTIFSVYLPLGK